MLITFAVWTFHVRKNVIINNATLNLIVIIDKATLNLIAWSQLPACLSSVRADRILKFFVCQSWYEKVYLYSL